jgi:hypothetical protein
MLKWHQQNVNKYGILKLKLSPNSGFWVLKQNSFPSYDWMTPLQIVNSYDFISVLHCLYFERDSFWNLIFWKRLIWVECSITIYSCWASTSWHNDAQNVLFKDHAIIFCTWDLFLLCFSSIPHLTLQIPSVWTDVEKTVKTLQV